MNIIAVARIVTLSSYFALFTLLLLWFGWLAPASHFPVGIMFLMITPLLFPLRGLIIGKPYTYAWTSFLIMLYFIHGVGEAYSNADERIYGILEIIFSVTLYTGAITYARLKGRELKARQNQN